MFTARYTLIFFFIVFGSELCVGQTTEQSGGVPASAPKFRPVRSVAGTKGAPQGGHFVMEDPRTVFYVPQDRQVIVYFDWDGPAGPHKFEALWKNPDGKVSVITDFSYTPKDTRFGGYFTLLLSETVTTGIWTLEARIDGEAAGTHTFQVVAGERPPGEENKPLRVPLPTAQIYQKLLPSTLTVEGLRFDGERLNVGSGFVLGDDTVATAFQIIDGATRVRIIFPDGRAADVEQVVAWDRWQDWALLKATTAAAPKLQRAPLNSFAVGDRCYSLSSSVDGGKVIVEMAITGRNSYSRAGERLNVSQSLGVRSAGAPLLNDYGEVIGILGGNLLPGINLLPSARLGQIGSIPGLSGTFRGPLAVPIQQVTLANARPSTLAEMKAAGVLTEALTGEWNFIQGALNRGFDKKTGSASLVDEKHEFSKNDKEFSVVISWDPKVKRKGTTTIRFYDLANRQLGESKPSPVELKPGNIRTVSWTVPTPRLEPGFYRVDVYLDTEPVWRTFFRVTD